MWIQVAGLSLRSYSLVNQLVTLEGLKTTKDDKKERELAELKEELTEEDVKAVSGGLVSPTIQLWDKKMRMSRDTLPCFYQRDRGLET